MRYLLLYQGLNNKITSAEQSTNFSSPLLQNSGDILRFLGFVILVLPTKTISSSRAARGPGFVPVWEITILLAIIFKLEKLLIFNVFLLFKFLKILAIFCNISNKIKLNSKSLMKIWSKTGTTGTFRGFSQSFGETTNNANYYIIFLT